LKCDQNYLKVDSGYLLLIKADYYGVDEKIYYHSQLINLIYYKHKFELLKREIKLTHIINITLMDNFREHIVKKLMK